MKFSLKKKENLIKQVRGFYKIRQNVFADYLGVTRSQLSMAEISQRGLPVMAMVTFVRLYKAIPQQKTEINDDTLKPEIDKQQSRRKSLGERKLNTNRYKLLLLNKKLEKLKKDQQDALDIIESLEILRMEAQPKDLGMIDIIEYTARKLQKKTGEDLQLKLELQIHSIMAEQSFLEKI